MSERAGAAARVAAVRGPRTGQHGYARSGLGGTLAVRRSAVTWDDGSVTLYEARDLACCLTEAGRAAMLAAEISACVRLGPEES